jgi:hypothetical protein
MDIVWVATGWLVLAIVLFDRRLLIYHGSRKIILTISLTMFVIAVLLPVFMRVFLRDKPVLYPSLMNPLVLVGLFLLMRKLFVRWKDREPIDTFHNWQKGLGADRWFNIVYFTLGPILMFLLYIGADLTGYKWH